MIRASKQLVVDLAPSSLGVIGGAGREGAAFLRGLGVPADRAKAQSAADSRVLSGEDEATVARTEAIVNHLRRAVGAAYARLELVNRVTGEPMVAFLEGDGAVVALPRPDSVAWTHVPSSRLAAFVLDRLSSGHEHRVAVRLWIGDGLVNESRITDDSIEISDADEVRGALLADAAGRGPQPYFDALLRVAESAAR